MLYGYCIGIIKYMSEQGVDFFEEEDAIRDRIEDFENKKYAGLVGVVIKITGLSKKRADLLLVFSTLIVFALAAGIFFTAYTDKEVKDDFLQRIEQSSINNSIR